MYLALVVRDSGWRVSAAPLCLSKDPRKAWKAMNALPPTDPGMQHNQSAVYLYVLGTEAAIPSLNELFGEETGRVPPRGLVCRMRSVDGAWQVEWFHPAAERELGFSRKERK
jgi:hypothetical protein